MPKVKELPKYDQPREKLARYGVTRLSEEELLAILLGSGIKGVNVVQLANKIQKVVEEKKDAITINDLRVIKGLGKVKSGVVLAALEYGKRNAAAVPDIKVDIEKVFELCSDIRALKREHLAAFYLNSRDFLIAREIISIGILDATLVHAREVFEPALRHNAAKVILAHNHPSGIIEPSEDDVDVTKNLVHAGKIFGIRVVDHLIVTKNQKRSIIDTN
jgi:DNA repair protein RadC